MVKFKGVEDVHSVGSLLKLYLRELPEPLIPFTFYERYLAIAPLAEGRRDFFNESVVGLTRVCQASLLLLSNIPLRFAGATAT